MTSPPSERMCHGNGSADYLISMDWSMRCSYPSGLWDIAFDQNAEESIPDRAGGQDVKRLKEEIQSLKDKLPSGSKNDVNCRIRFRRQLDCAELLFPALPAWAQRSQIIPPVDPGLMPVFPDGVIA